MDSLFTVYHQSLCTCCDIISRLANEVFPFAWVVLAWTLLVQLVSLFFWLFLPSADLTRLVVPFFVVNGTMQILLHDMETLLKQQITHQTLQTRYNQLLLELKEKTDQISINKLQHNLDDNPLEDFEMFVKGVWKKINKKLDKERSNAKFLSAKRGIPISILADQLLDFCFHCSYTYKNIFLHPHCCEQFNVIYSQLSNVVFPEVQYSDDFEKSQIFIQAATPCLKNLLMIVDKFIYNEKFNSVESLCKALIGNETQPGKRMITLLDCIDFLSTSFDEGIPKLKSLLIHVDEMTAYILKISALPKRPQPNVQNRIAGILNSVYMDCIHPANMSPKMYHVQLNNMVKESPFKCETQKIVGATRRRRRRFHEDSTNTIKVPKLQMQPFPY